jgi:hypothetical protein
MAERGGLPWYCVWTDFPVHPKTLALCGRLRDDNAGMYVLRLFSHCATHALDGLIDADVVEGAAGWRKKRGALLAALVAVGALKARDGGRYEVHGWVERNGARIREWLRCNAKRRPRNPDEDAQGTPDEPHEEPREDPAGFSGGTPTEPRVPYEIQKTEKKQKPARLQRPRRANGEPKSASEAATVAPPPPAVEAASGAVVCQAAAAASVAAREPAAVTEPERAEVSHAPGPGKPATHPSAAGASSPPAAPAAAAPRSGTLDPVRGADQVAPPKAADSRAAPGAPRARPRGPVVDDLTRPPLLVVDTSELPVQAATVRGELEQRLGNVLDLADGFAEEVVRLGEERALEVYAREAADYLAKHPGEAIRSLAFFVKVGKRYRPLASPPRPTPPLPGPTEEWLASLGDRRPRAEAQWQLAHDRILRAAWPERRAELLQREIDGLVARFPPEEPPLAAGGASC